MSRPPPGKGGTPRSTLPREPDGAYRPDPEARGSPHTTVGTRVGSDGKLYRQGATFGEDGVFKGRTDNTDHGTPRLHPLPHFHPATSPNGVGRAEPIPTFDVGPELL